eukprot:142363-Pleurochrysis_carterae.AAC.1
MHVHNELAGTAGNRILARNLISCHTCTCDGARRCCQVDGEWMLGHDLDDVGEAGLAKKG